MFSRKSQAVLLLAIVRIAALAPQSIAQAVDPPSDNGVVFVAGGVGGWDILGAASQWELPRVGIHHEIRDFAWTHGFGQPFKDLQDTPHLRRKADELAEEIRKVKKKDPRRPIY
jgi:hypothetical protein